MASDVTTLKPGLEFDTRQIIGSTIDIDCEYVKAHEVPDLRELKETLVTEVDVTFLTTLDNKVSFPVGVYYLTKQGSGDDRYTQFADMIYVVQACICTNCLSTTPSNQHIVNYTPCTSYCLQCVASEAVCDECKLLGHTSHKLQLRRCNQCVKDNIKCCKFAVLFVASDCKEKN